MNPYWQLPRALSATQSFYFNYLVPPTWVGSHHHCGQRWKQNTGITYWCDPCCLLGTATLSARRGPFPFSQYFHRQVSGWPARSLPPFAYLSLVTGVVQSLFTITFLGKGPQLRGLTGLTFCQDPSNPRLTPQPGCQGYITIVLLG